MAKGYWIVHVTVTDPKTYADYLAADAIAFAKYGARPIVRGGRYEAPEGPALQRHVVIEFDSYEQALACYRSPEYAAALPHRRAASESQIVIVEGVG
jgi:uncharacterized protein (DUF1330 family)